MTSTAFQTANKIGKEGEQYVAGMINSWEGYKAKLPPDGYFAEYDLEVINPNKIRSTVEVKTDKKAHQTGNICLEIEALDHSKADFLAIVTEYPKTVYFKELPAVREFAHQFEPKKRGGEFNGELALVPRSIFIDRLKPVILTTKFQH